MSLRPALAFNPRPRRLSTPLLTPLNSTPTFVASRADPRRKSSASDGTEFDAADAFGFTIGAGEVIKKSGIAKLSVVGIGMRSHSGVAATLFECLGAGGVNIQMISTSEIKIAVIIDEDRIQDAARLAHEAFGLAG